MKKCLLVIAAIVFSTIVNAQSYEIGLNGGLSATSKPHQSLYEGQTSYWNAYGALSFRYLVNEHWHVGATIGITGWERKDKWPLSNTNNMSLGEQNVKIVLAKQAVNFQLELNHVIPFYERYEDFVRSNVYFGVAVGGLVIGNDGKVMYSRVNPKTPAEYTYTSEFHYESGYGFMLGVQAGYTYFVNRHLGINAEVAPKIAWVRTKDPRMGGSNDTYRLLYYPVSIGVHYRFGYHKW